jgi:hypothetical protein
VLQVILALDAAPPLLVQLSVVALPLGTVVGFETRLAPQEGAMVQPWGFVYVVLQAFSAVQV